MLKLNENQVSDHNKVLFISFHIALMARGFCQ